MKKTVTLNSLVKAKSDLELFIKVEETKRLQKLFTPNFDISEIDSNIEKKEDQLIIIKEAISIANTITKDEEGNSINHYIYKLSKLNRRKADLGIILSRIDSTNNLLDKSKVSEKLLDDIRDLGNLIEKAKKSGDKKKEAEHTKSRNNLKRSLSKTSSKTKVNVTALEQKINKDLELVEVAIENTKAKLTTMNANSAKIEVEILDGFDIVIS